MKLNKKLWWILLPTIIVAGTVTTVLLVLPKTPGLPKSSKYSKEELFAMETQVENAYKVAAEDNYGYVIPQNKSLYAVNPFETSIQEHQEEFHNEFTPLIENANTFEDRLEVANKIEEDAQENNLSICSWEKVEDQKYDLMQDYIASSFERIKENGERLSEPDKAALTSDIYIKAETLGKQIDELAEKNESLTEFLLTDNNNDDVLKQFITKVNSNLSDDETDFNQKYQTKLQTRATYAFDNLSENLTIASPEEGAEQYDLNTELSKTNALGESVKLYGTGTNDDQSPLANQNYRYINEQEDGSIPLFKWNYKFWDSNKTWFSADDPTTENRGDYNYDLAVFNGHPVTPGDETRYPILGGNPALDHLVVKLAIQTVDNEDGTSEIAYDFNPTDCTATYHLNVVIVDTSTTFNDDNNNTYNYMVTSPISFTQAASRLQIRKYVAQQNKDVLTIDQDDQSGENNSIKNVVNSFQSIGVFFDKESFKCSEADGKQLEFTPFVQRHTADGISTQDAVGTYLEESELDNFYSVKINFKDVSENEGWSSKIFNYMVSKAEESEPFYDVNGAPVTSKSRSATISISTLNAVLQDIDYVAKVNTEEYQGLQVVGKVMSITARQPVGGGDAIGFDINTQLFLRQANYEEDSVSGVQTDATSKYKFAEYPLLAKNLDLSNTETEFKDTWSVDNYKVYYEYHKSNFDGITIPLHYTDKELAYLNFCKNFKRTYAEFQKFSTLALELDSTGEKFYKIYEKHEPLFPLYITSVVALMIATIIDAALLCNYIIGLPATLVMVIVQSVIFALDLVFVVLASIQSDAVRMENLAYDAEKFIWDQFVPSFKEICKPYYVKLCLKVNENYQNWLKNEESATLAETLYKSVLTFYKEAIDHDESNDCNLDGLLCSLFNNVKKINAGTDEFKNKEYVHIDIHTSFDDIMNKIPSQEDKIDDPFSASTDTAISISQIVVTIIVGLVSLNFAIVVSGMISQAVQTWNINSAAGVRISQLANPSEVALTKMVQTTPFSIARAIIIVIIIALSIATMVIHLQVQSLIDEYTNDFK